MESDWGRVSFSRWPGAVSQRRPAGGEAQQEEAGEGHSGSAVPNLSAISITCSCLDRSIAHP